MLTINGNITYNAGGPAVISGILDLPGHSNIAVATGANETLVGGVQNYDLTISAQISGGGFAKLGTGALLINNPNNSFAGASAVQTVTIGATTGSYLLVFNGQTTGSLNNSSTATQIQTR